MEKEDALCTYAQKTIENSHSNLEKQEYFAVGGNDKAECLPYARER
jgi:hypothetical protein